MCRFQPYVQIWLCLSFSDVFLSGNEMNDKVCKVTFWKGKLPFGCLCAWLLGWGYVILGQMLLNVIVFIEILFFFLNFNTWICKIKCTGFLTTRLIKQYMWLCFSLELNLLCHASELFYNGINSITVLLLILEKLVFYLRIENCAFYFYYTIYMC